MHEPYKQGDLDGLCGVYAVINAIGSILPDFWDLHGFLSELFKVCIDKLDRRTDLAKTIVSGTSIHMIKEMLNDCKEYMENNRMNNNYSHKYTLNYEFLCKNRVRANAIINDIRNDLSKFNNTAIILGIRGRNFAHWTTINKEFIKTIKFHDSDELHKIKIDEIYAGKSSKSKSYYIDPDEVISVWLTKHTI